MRLVINIPSGTTVNGNINQEDSSADFDITVASGDNGYFNIENKGDGDVIVTVGDKDVVNGKNKDNGDGIVNVALGKGSVFNGNTRADDAGLVKTPSSISTETPGNKMTSD